MDKYSYINEIRNFVEQFLDNDKEVSPDVIQYNCIMCGRSRNNSPHMRIDYMGGFYYCYRCNEGGILYNLLKECKNNNNTEYINTLLKVYFDYFEYDPLDKKIQSINNYSSYDFTINNLTVQDVGPPEFSDIQLNFFKHRFPTLTDVQLNNIVKKFKILLHKSGDKLFYNSFHRKFAYCYKLNKDLTHQKEKFKNSNINNDKKDYYYLINKQTSQNLYIAEGLFDLMTVDITDKIRNAADSNFLAFCSRNYKFLYEVLLNSGKFYYENIYIVIDNDVNESKFIDGIVSTLSNTKNNSKYKIYKNIYTINVPNTFIDFNDYYLTDNSVKDLLIKKIK